MDEFIRGMLAPLLTVWGWIGPFNFGLVLGTCLWVGLSYLLVKGIWWFITKREDPVVDD